MAICLRKNFIFVYCLSSISFEKLREEKFKELSELRDWMMIAINFIIEGAIWRNAKKRIEYVFVVDDKEIAKERLIREAKANMQTLV